MKFKLSVFFLIHSFLSSLLYAHTNFLHANENTNIETEFEKLKNGGTVLFTSRYQREGMKTYVYLLERCDLISAFDQVSRKAVLAKSSKKTQNAKKLMK